MSMQMNPLLRRFYQRDAERVARDLLGRWLVRESENGVMVAEIVETEAYLGVTDPACHSYGGRRTARTEVMYGEGGRAYVYFVYGMHCLLNAVTGLEGEPCAVLIRAAKPIEGQDRMAQNRFGLAWRDLTPAKRRALMDGPGKLCRALAVGLEDNRADLCEREGALRVCEGAESREFAVEATPRIGVDYAGEAASWPLRFCKSEK